MINYKRSICSTCRYLEQCVLTTDKSNISSCSEYIHTMDEDYRSEPVEKVQMFRSVGYPLKTEEELILN